MEACPLDAMLSSNTAPLLPGRVSFERGAVGRKQNAAVAIGHFQRRHEQAFEIRFDLESFSAV